MKALVIFYDGNTPTTVDVQNLAENASFITGKCEVVPFSADKIAGMLVSSCKAPKVDVESGDDAVTIIVGLTDMSTFVSFSSSIIELFRKAENNFDDTAKVFLKACSILSQPDIAAPISSEVARKYGFTYAMRDTIRQFYKHWNNGKNN